MKLKCDEPLSNVAFNVNLRRYITGRKIAFVGMSLTTYLEAAKKAGLAPIDPDSLVPADEIDNVNPNELLIVTTGSQGEARVQLSQAAFGGSRLITLQPSDLLLYSAKMIPGNEKKVMRMMNAIAQRGQGRSATGPLFSDAPEPLFGTSLID